MIKISNLLKMKVKAGVVHLILTALLISLLFSTMIFMMYPGPLFELEGGKKVLTIVLLVDLVIGPFLTFIVFDPLKKSLKMDLAIIVALQLSFLAYGIKVVIDARPVFLVFSKDRYVIVSAADIDVEQLQFKGMKQLSYSGPKLVGVNVTDKETLSKITYEVAQGGAEVEFRSEYYEPYDRFKSMVAERALDISTLNIDENHKKEFHAIVREHELNLEGIDENKFGLLPVLGKAKVMSAVVKKDSAQIIGYIDYDPWES